MEKACGAMLDASGGRAVTVFVVAKRQVLQVSSSVVQACML